MTTDADKKYFVSQTFYSRNSGNLKNSFMGQEIIPLEIFHPNISVRIPGRGKMSFSQVRPLLALLLNFGHFGHFEPVST